MIYVVEIIYYFECFDEISLVQFDDYYPIPFAAENFIISGCWFKNINTRILALCEEKQFYNQDRIIPIYNLIDWNRFLNNKFGYRDYLIDSAPDKDFIFILAKKKNLPYWALSKIKKQITEYCEEVKHGRRIH